MDMLARLEDENKDCIPEEGEEEEGEELADRIQGKDGRREGARGGTPIKKVCGYALPDRPPFLRPKDIG